MSPEHGEGDDVPPLHEEHLAFLAAVRTLLGAREVDALRDDLVAANLLRVAPRDPTRRLLEPSAYFLTPAGVAALDRAGEARRER